jgi:hypothetical protein
MTAPPPGWYPDPSGAPGRRYWDGRQFVAAPGPPFGQPHYGPPFGQPNYRPNPKNTPTGALIARNVCLVLGGIASVVWLAMRFSMTVTTADGINCRSRYGVPRAELEACAVALDNYHHELGLIFGLAAVFFIVALVVHLTAKRA